MTDNDRFYHFLKKYYEALHLMFRHYIPNGKPYPEHYSEVLLELYRIWDKGCLEELTQEPIIEEEVKQLDMFTFNLFNQSANMSVNENGTDIDISKPKT